MRAFVFDFAAQLTDLVQQVLLDRVGPHLYHSALSVPRIGRAYCYISTRHHLYRACFMSVPDIAYAERRQIYTLYLIASVICSSAPGSSIAYVSTVHRIAKV
eukprot:1861310-Rhodomonas_salina.1